jgi:hypothetical protein
MHDNDIFMTMSTDNEFGSRSLHELRVLSGIHKGAALILPADTVTIGSDSNCTVVLMDDGVRPLHVTLQWIQGKGFAHADSPEINLSEPLLAGPVWICVVPPETPWTDSHLLRADVPRHTLQNQHPPVSFGQSGFASRKHAWALWGLVIASSLSLIFAVMELESDYAVGMSSPKDLPQTDIYEHQRFQQPAVLVFPNQSPEEPKEGVMAVVSGLSGFVLLRDGQRIYVGEEFERFVLMDVQSGVPMWRPKVYTFAEE